MEKRTIPRSAQYGQACMSCFKAKSRCVLRSEGDGCERCHRLERECLPADTLRRRATATEHTQDSDDRIARIEGRLESLVSLLQSRQVLGGGTTAHTPEQQDTSTEPSGSGSRSGGSRAFSTPTAGSSSLDTIDTMDNDEAAIDVDDIPAQLPGTPAPHIPSPPAPVSTLPMVIDTPEDLSVKCLDTFRSRMLRHFPFVHLPAGLTVEKLRTERPLFFRAIICVASPSSHEKRTRRTDLKRLLCETAFLREQRLRGPYEDALGRVIDPAADLLLSLLTYIAWGWDHLQSHCSPSRLIALCTSIIGQMHLDRPAPSDLHTANFLAAPSSSTRPRLSLERQRAVLGCFVLSSVVSAYFADMDPMRWTPQMEQIRIAVGDSQEWPGDADLANQALLQLVAIKAAQLQDKLQQLHIQYRSNLAQSATSVVAVTSDAKSLLGQLQQLRQSLSWASQHLQPHTYYVELLVLEVIRISSSLESLSNEPSATSTPGLSGLSDASTKQSIQSGSSDLSYMWQSVLAISACTSSLLAIAPSDFVGISFCQWEQLAGCIVVLSHLESLNDPRVNLSASRAVVDLPVLLDQTADKLTSAAREAGEGDPDATFTQLAWGIRTFRSHIQGSMVELTRPGPGEVSGCGGSNVTVIPQQSYFQNNKFWLDQFFRDWS